MSGNIVRYVLLFGAAAWPATALAQAAAPAPSEFAAQVAAYQPAPGDQGGFDKHFFFHKPGVSLETATADLQECRSYNVAVVLNPLVPEHLPPEGWRPPSANNYSYGLAGAAVLAFIAPGLIHGVAAANMRKCMAFKGYGRYGLSKALWETLNPKDPAEAMALAAQVASSAKPAQASLYP